MPKSNTQPHVVVMEGDASIGMLIEHVLSNHGFATTLLADGLLASDHIAGRESPDLVLLDTAIPFVAGYDLMERIRQAGGGWETVPVILTSMRTNEREIVRGFEAGAADFITKPFRVDELVARVRRIVKSGSQNQSLPGVVTRIRPTGRRKSRQSTNHALCFSA